MCSRSVFDPDSSAARTADHSAAGRIEPAKNSDSTLALRIVCRDAKRARQLRDRLLHAAGSSDPAFDGIALPDGFAHHLGERRVCGRDDNGRERAAERAFAVCGRVQQDLQTQPIDQLGLRALLQHLEAGGHVRLERELVQQARAERVDRLHLEAARRFQRLGEQPSRALPPLARGPPPLDPCASPRRDPRRRARSSAPSVPNTRLAMLAAAALVKVRQSIFAGSVPSSSSRMTRCAST